MEYTKAKFTFWSYFDIKLFSLCGTHTYFTYAYDTYNLRPTPTNWYWLRILASGKEIHLCPMGEISHSAFVTAIQHFATVVAAQLQAWIPNPQHEVQVHAKIVHLDLLHCWSKSCLEHPALQAGCVCVYLLKRSKTCTWFMMMIFSRWWAIGWIILFPCGVLLQDLFFSTMTILHFFSWKAGGPRALGWRGPTKTHPSCCVNVPAHGDRC